jgi:hypothetical protein
MRLLVSVLLFLTTSAALGQDPHPTPAPTWQVAVIDSAGQTSTPDLGVRSNLLALAKKPPLTDHGDRSTCFTMRSYRFVRPDPKSDVTKLSGYSTCASASTLDRRQTRDGNR